MEEHTTTDGRVVYVDREDGLTGSEGPFYPAYDDADGTGRYGYLCAACDTLDNAMDTMGRIVCNECGNTRKPDEWDAAHE